MAAAVLNTDAQLNGKTLATTDSAQTISAIKTFSVDQYIAATVKLYLDGGNNTYLLESAADQVDLFTGGTIRVRVTTSYALFASINLQVSSTYKIYLDGGSNTYLAESASDTITVTTGASESVFFVATGIGKTTWSTTATAANAWVGNGDVVKLSTSLLAVKHDVRPIGLDEARTAVQALRPVLYRSRIDEDQRAWPGFIADWMAEDVPSLATYDAKTGALQSVAYDRVPAYLVPVVQDHESRLRALEARHA